MMARWAQIVPPQGFIVNVIEWNGDLETWAPPDGFVMVEDIDIEASPGGFYVDGVFYPPGVLPPS